MKDEWARSVKTSTSILTNIGLASTAVFFVGFGAWAATAPISGAVVAPGVVIADGRNQQIQHLEGGIVRRVLVEEGQRVESGQIVVELDAKASKAQRDRVKKQSLALKARSARLTAERDNKAALSFPKGLVELAAAEGSTSLLKEQDQEFRIKLSRYRHEKTILKQRILALEEQISGVVAQKAAVDRQLQIVEDEAARKKQLLERGLTNRSEYTSLIRSQADLVGRSAQLSAGILATRNNMIEAEERLAHLDTQRVEAAITQLNEVRSRQIEIQERLFSAEDILSRRLVRSPTDGVVISIETNTEGAVIAPGTDLMTILPTNERLVVETRISVQDIDNVRIGRAAKLRFSALNTRSTPTIDSVVAHISADRIEDPTTQQSYYKAQLRFGDALPPTIAKEDIYPGMPVETYISTESRTFLDYLTRPIADSFTRAFREE